MKDLKDYSSNLESSEFLNKMLLYLRKEAGDNLKLEEAFALIGILVSEKIKINEQEFSNDPYNDNTWIDTLEASALMSVLLKEQEIDPLWLKATYLNRNKFTAQHIEVTKKFMRHLKVIR